MTTDRETIERAEEFAAEEPSEDRPSDEAADVLIIGAGASGGAVAWRLAQAGFRVVCLEQGRWLKPSRYPTRERNWEIRGRHEWNWNPNHRDKDEDYPVNDSESPISPLMFNAVGGSTIHWTAHTPRFHPSDFKVRSLDGVADDWPFTYWDLEPYYDLNDMMMGCAGINGDPAVPPRSPRPMPPLPLGEDGKRMSAAFERLGWHWWPSDNYINSVPYQGREACNYCGPIGLGCVRRAKSSTDVTYWPEAIRYGAQLRTRCRVAEVTVDSSGRATGARYYDRDGNLRHQAARSVVVAANGIGTPRLLLMSKSDSHPYGMLNSSGLVGKNLMFHPYAIVSGFIPDLEENWKGPMGNILMCQEFYETRASHDFVRGYAFQMNRGSGPLATAMGGAHGAIPWGEQHHREFAERFGRQVTLAGIGEDLPEEHNQVTLDHRLRDSNGLPAPKVSYTLSENSRRIMDHAVRTATQALQEAGATKVLANRLLRAGGWHLMGTARMGEDPRRSVVNPWGQAHDADNVFIVDGSVFVTAGAVNPTPTLQAIALRTGDYIVHERTDLKA
ncbi:MAG: GMC family oxidoreductase [Chloroflexota bacterium]